MLTKRINDIFKHLLNKVRKPWDRPWHRHENEERLRSTGLQNTADYYQNKSKKASDIV